MSAVATFLFTAGRILRGLWELARYALRLCWSLLPKATLAARVLAVESQLVVALNRPSPSGAGRGDSGSANSQRRRRSHRGLRARRPAPSLLSRCRLAGKRTAYLHQVGTAPPIRHGRFAPGIRKSSGGAPYFPLFAPSASAAMGLRPSVRAPGWDHWGGQPAGDPPKVDVNTVRRYATNLPALLTRATDEEKRTLAQAFLTGISLDPETRNIEVGLRAPLLSSTCGGGGRSRTGE